MRVTCALLLLLLLLLLLQARPPSSVPPGHEDQREERTQHEHCRNHACMASSSHDSFSRAQHVRSCNNIQSIGGKHAGKQGMRTDYADIRVPIRGQVPLLGHSAGWCLTVEDGGVGIWGGSPVTVARPAHGQPCSLLAMPAPAPACMRHSSCSGYGKPWMTSLLLAACSMEGPAIALAASEPSTAQVG